jgi:hypothetical protein
MKMFIFATDKGNLGIPAEDETHIDRIYKAYHESTIT